MWAFLQPISARIYFGKTASHRTRACLVQSRGASPQAYWMSVKAAQRWGCAKRAFCGVCFLMPGGLSARLLFVGRGAVRGRGKSPSPTGRNGFPHQCVPQGHLLRGAHWRGMTALRAGNGGTHGSRPTGCGGHPGRTEASAPTKQNRNRAKRDVEDAVPYDGGHEPCKTGRRGRRALHTLLLRGAKRRGNPFSPTQRDGFPRQ